MKSIIPEINENAESSNTTSSDDSDSNKNDGMFENIFGIDENEDFFN
jgi:hypothetical protein